MLPGRYYLGVLVYAALLYANALRGDFVYDDSRAIVENLDLQRDTPWSSLLVDDFWGTPINSSNSHGSYRPLVVATFKLNYHLHGAQPFGFHLVNLAIHLAAIYLYGRLLDNVLRLPSQTCLAAMILFASHPVHVESVASIVARADLMATAFYLLALLAYHRFVRTNRLIFLYETLAAAWGSLLSKEYAITCLPACGAIHLFAILPRLGGGAGGWLLQLWTSPRHSRFRVGLAHLTASLVLMLAFRVSIAGHQRPSFAKADNPAAVNESVITRTLTFWHLPVFNFCLLVWPRWLSFDWSMESIPLVTDLYDQRNLLTLVFFAVLLYFGLRLVNDKTKQAKQSKFNKLVIKKKPTQSVCHRACTAVERETMLDDNNNDDNSAIDFNRYLKPLNVQFDDDDANNNNNNNEQIDLNNNNNNSNSNNNNGNNNNNIDPNNNNNNNSKLKSPVLVYTRMVKPVVKSKPVTKRQNVQRKAEGDSLSTQDHLMIGVLLMVVPFLPATNLFVYVGFVVAERILYLPSAGYCLLVAIGFETLVKRWQSYRRCLYAIFALLIVVFAVRTVTRTFDWLNEEALYSSAVPINPPKALGNLANVLSGQGRRAEAEKAYRTALTYRPNMADVHYNLGLLLQEEGKLTEAIESYRRAISYRPRLAVAYLNLGIALVKLGKAEEAKSIFERCTKLDGHGLKNIRLHETTKISALYNLGRIYADQGEHERAIELYLEAVARAPPYYRAQSLYNMLGDSHFRLNRIDEAERWFRRSMVKAKGKHVPTLLSYGQMLAKLNRTTEAERFFQKAVEQSPKDCFVHQHYGKDVSI